MAQDMLVKLYDLPDYNPLFAKVDKAGYRLVRGLACDRFTVREAVQAVFPYWVGEVDAAFSKETPSIFLAVKDKQPVGFACYNATAKGFFGPVGVLEAHRGHALGVALLGKCLLSMEAEGFGYAVIGWTELADYYAKACNAIPIPDSFPGIYSRMIGMEQETDR